MAHRYRLCPTEEQVAALERHCADARFLWNLALEQTNIHSLYRNLAPVPAPWPTPGTRSKQLTEAREAFSWLAEGIAATQQMALRDFDQAMKNWWAGTHERPTFRKRGLNEGFCIRNDNVKVVRLNRRWATIDVPKLSPVRFRLSRPMPEKYGQARITKDRSGRWHVSFSAPQPPVIRSATGEHVGVDMGIASTATLSTGEHLRMPSLLTNGEAQRKRRLERKKARQVPGSNGWKRTKICIAKITAREVDRRKDWVEKTTTDLVRRFDFVAIEDLQVKNMLRSAKGTVEKPGTNVAQKRGLNRSISSQAWGMFRLRLEQKAATCDVTVVSVNPANTSRRCAACGHTALENRKNQAAFKCRSCGRKANADVNAAMNILADGLSVTALGGTAEAMAPVKSEPHLLSLVA